MSYCINCGKQVDPKDKFCINCGKPVEKDTITSSQGSELETKRKEWDEARKKAEEEKRVKEEVERLEKDKLEEEIKKEADQETRKDIFTVTPPLQDKVASQSQHSGEHQTPTYIQPINVGERRSTSSTNKTAVILLSVFLALSVIGAGVLGFLFIDKSDQYTRTAEDLIQANQEISGLITTNTGLQNDISSLDNQVSNLTVEKSNLQSDLDDINDVYPPGSFSSVTQLINWVNSHIYLISGTAWEQAFMMQELAIAEGYIWNVGLSTTGTFISNVLVGNDIYWVESDGDCFDSGYNVP